MELAHVGAPLHPGVTWSWVLLLGIIALAAMTQRITGLGFALIATPAALIMLGPQAVSFVALLGGAVGALALAATWRALRMRAVVSVTAITLLAMIPTVIVAVHISPAWSSITAGILVMLATLVASVQNMTWARRVLGSPIVAGALTGVSAGLAGLAGPPAAAYGTIRAWGDSFVPNLQVVLISTLPALLIGRGWPRAVPLWLVLASLAAISLGTLAGSVARAHISQSLAMIGTRALAVLGGGIAVVHGVSAL